eukprot:NODE_6773_length_1640_cov_4.902181.p1 GENE.NODE_6773_length_1640_cov_4.902181~~NODE_6773_length_1640_cov_4.902181.p1  ORF type:complete len:382 (+),score=11.10 NODE_6773_length_1640_cov_4.902181:342-1487(+)
MPMSMALALARDELAQSLNGLHRTRELLANCDLCCRDAEGPAAEVPVCSAASLNAQTDLDSNTRPAASCSFTSEPITPATVATGPILPSSSRKAVVPTEISVHFQATPQVLAVTDRTILRTRFGMWLNRSHRTFKLITLCSLLLTLAVYTYERNYVERRPYYYSSGEQLLAVYIVEPIPSARFLMFLGSSIFVFLALHMYTWTLFVQAFCTFKSFMMISSMVCSACARRFNDYMALYPNELLTVRWVLFDILFVCGTIVPCTVLFVTIDAYCVQPKPRVSRGKICLVGALLVYSVWYYIKNRFFEDEAHPTWTVNDVCFSPIAPCTSIQTLCVVPLGNFIAYLLNMFVNYLRGRSFAFISSTYVFGACEHNDRSAVVRWQS